MQRVENRGEVAHANVMQLHPLLQDSAVGEVLADERVKFATVQAGGAGEPDARKLHADEVVLRAVHQQVIASVGQVHRQARVVERSAVGPRKEQPRGLDDRRRDLDHVDRSPRITSDRAERGAGAEPDHQRAIEAPHEQRRVVGETALGVHFPAVVALEFAVRVQGVDGAAAQDGGDAAVRRLRAESSSSSGGLQRCRSRRWCRWSAA